jgi:hypothetical protein
MRNSIFYTLLVCFVFACAQGNAQSLTKIYSGKDSPAQTGWTELKMDKTISPATEAVATATPTGTTEALPDGVLQLRSTNAADQFSQLGWYKTDLKLNQQTGYTIEIKAKITEASKYGAFNIQGFDNFGKGFRIGIYKDRLAESTNPLAATNELKSGLTNDDKFHIYTITVNTDRILTLYRDGVEMGTFPVTDFYFDNIIENGGFEDGADDMNNASFFPDFLSKSLLYRTIDPEIDKPAEGYRDRPFVHTGKYALIFNSNGKHEATGDQFNPETSERARTRDIAVKPNTKYDISISRCRIKDEPWAWRDMGAFYNFQLGTEDGVDERGDNALFAGANDDWWQIHNQTITTPSATADRVANSIRFEFPSWIRDGSKDIAITAFDDFYVKENLGLTVGSDMGRMVDLALPANYVNLIKNGDFEDWTVNNDGSDYDWALSNLDDVNNNEPVAFNPLWNGDVRIQRNNKPDDEIGGQWAHSGESSLRFSSLGRHGTFAFTKELEANKTYRFNFWHRSPRWPETAWVKVKVGDNVVWGQELGCPHFNGRNNVWANADMTFKTTDANKTLVLYADADTYGDWFNIFFDDLVLIEIANADDPLLAGKTNLIANGDFENDMLGNDGKPYMWALASEFTGEDDNYPVKWNDMWGTYVRLQDKQKVMDTGLQWAHSGTKSLRMSYLDNEGAAIDFGDPDAYRTNMNFVKELEPNKTYTFVFWIKTANYPDKGNLKIANGEVSIWEAQLSTKYINWSRQSVTFSTTEKNHTLRMYTEWTGWYNFYLDDLFLYEETGSVTLPAESTYLFFGKSMGTQSANVDIEYVAIDNTGANAPTGIKKIALAQANLNAWSSNSNLLFKTIDPAFVQVYTVTGQLVAQLNVKKEASIALPQGIYIVKSVSASITETIKVIIK